MSYSSQRYSRKLAELKRPSTTSVASASISAWSLGQDVRDSEMPQLSQRLYAIDLERQARERVIELTTKIKNATHPRLSPLVEDYYLFMETAGNRYMRIS